MFIVCLSRIANIDFSDIIFANMIGQLCKYGNDYFKKLLLNMILYIFNFPFINIFLQASKYKIHTFWRNLVFK